VPLAYAASERRPAARIPPWVVATLGGWWHAAPKEGSDLRVMGSGRTLTIDHSIQVQWS